MVKVNASYYRKYRKERKAKAAVLGIAVKDLPDTRGTNRGNKSCYFSDKHHNYLYHAAHRIARQFPNRNIDVNELVNVGWYGCARYHEDVTKEYQRILTKMFQFAVSQQKGVAFDSINVPMFVENADEMMNVLSFRRNERLSTHDDTVEKVSEILETCSSDEKELLRLRFYWGLTLKEIGCIYEVGPSNLTIKYQRLFERIRKRACGEETRSLRTSLTTC